jgi:hypothetical protein
MPLGCPLLIRKRIQWKETPAALTLQYSIEKQMPGFTTPPRLPPYTVGGN